MKSLLQSGRRALRVALCALALLSIASPARSEETTVLIEERFENGLNWNWYNEWSVEWMYEGYDGYNGSAWFNQYWYYYPGPMTTSPVDASLYANTADALYLEFDMSMDQNYYHMDYGVDDKFNIKAMSSEGEETLIDLSVQTDYTYQNYDYYPPYNPPTDPSYWRHYRIEIPAGVRASDLQISITASPDWGYAAMAIDNMVITGTHYTTFSFTPATIIFPETVVDEVTAIEYIEIKNPNSGDIAITDIALTGSHADEFEIVSTVGSIPGGSIETPGTGTIGVRFTPKATGTRSATLVFTGDVDVDRDAGVELRGNAVAPVISLNGTKPLFTKTRTRLTNWLDQSFVITNIGNQGNLIIKPTTAIEGEFANQYSIPRLPSAPIQPGQSDTITVRYLPTEEGARTAELVIRSNADNGDQRLLLRGTGILQRFTITPEREFSFDSVAMGQTVCQTFTITNPGSDTLAVELDYLAFADPDFTFTGLTDPMIAPERSRDIQVCFTPRGMGTRLARLRFVTNIPNTIGEQSIDTGDFYVNLTGTGVPYGVLALNAGTGIDSVMIGEERCQTATIQNTGMSSLTIMGATISGTEAGEFEIQDATYPMTIAAGGSRDVIICATPGGRGLRGAMVTLLSTSNGRMDTSIVPVGIYGLLACAKPGTTTLFDSRTIAVGSTDSMTLEVTNCGDVAAAYTANTVSSDYQIIGNATSPVVQAGETASFWVRFTPSTIGASSGSLQITAPGVDPIDVPLNGIGGGVTAANGMFEIPGTSVGSSNTFTVTVTNNGNMDWTTGTPAISTNAYSYTGSSVTIPAGGSQDLAFTFTPTAVGANTATVTFPGATPTPTPVYSIALSGQGLASSVKTPSSINGYTLMQNYPNPFNPATTVRFTAPNSGVVRIDITDMKGEVVATATNEYYPAGTHEVKVDASTLTSGTFFYVLSTGDVKLTRQMTLVK